jgi:hypothetical protein
MDEAIFSNIFSGVFLILIPLLYAIFGTIINVLMSLLYNLLSLKLGGIKVQIDSLAEKSNSQVQVESSN